MDLKNCCNISKVYIKTTNACNLCCEHCYIGDFRKQHLFFNEQDTVKYLKDIINKDTLITFHGGEPFLCDIDKMQYVCDSFPDIEYDATTNLIWNEPKKCINFIQKNCLRRKTGKPFMKTSYDADDVRFKTSDIYNRWSDNLKTCISEGIDVHVIVCLTNKLLSMDPQQLLNTMHQLGVTLIDFERLTANTTEDKTLIPSYEEVDSWLCKFYDLNDFLRVELFENIREAYYGFHCDCRKRQCMSSVLTINPDGTLGGCPNTACFETFGDIYKGIDQEKRIRLICKENVRNPLCYICDLFPVCNGDCHQLSWQGNSCPAPKNLMRRIIDVEKTKEVIILDT